MVGSRVSLLLEELGEVPVHVHDDFPLDKFEKFGYVLNKIGTVGRSGTNEYRFPEPPSNVFLISLPVSRLLFFS